MTRTRLQLLEQSENVPVSFATLVNSDLFFDSLPRGIESLVIKRLQQVVEGMHLEGSDGVVIVGCNEDHVRSRLGFERRKNLEAAQLWHLYIQKDKIGLERFDRIHRFTTIGTLRDYLVVGIIEKHLANHLASEWFIVDDQRENTSCVRHFASNQL